MIFPMIYGAGRFWFCVASAAGAVVTPMFLSGCRSEASPAESAVEARVAPSAVWSDARTGVFPKSGGSYHGLFLAEPLSVTLRDLPAHKLVKVRFNLIVLGSWDGSGPVWGPDLWSLQVRGGQRLMCTTFSNMGAYNGNVPQAFPDDYPWIKNPAWTGAVSRDTHEFPRATGFSTKRDLNDAVYPVEVVFPHEGESVTLDMMGNYGDPRLSQQSWAISDFEFSTAEDFVVADDAALARYWADLASHDAVKANAALWTLAAGGDRVHAYISGQVALIEAEVAKGARPVPPVTGDEARRLHRAHRLVRILCGEGTSDLCFRMELLIPEYYR